MLVLGSAALWIQKSQEAIEIALMFIETRTDEVVMIATSCVLWKNKTVRVEIFQKSFTDMPIS